MFELIKELDKFNEIRFNDPDHSYFFKDRPCMSVTEFIGSYKKPFPAEIIAAKYAKKHGLTKQEVLDDWEEKKVTAQVKGTEIHKYIEMKFCCRNYVPNLDVDLGLIEMVDNFYKDTKNKLIPIKQEFIVGDYTMGICGTIDSLFYNKKSNEIQIWDYKTNKDITYKSKYKKKMMDEVKHLEECEMNTYSLQLEIYKQIIERNTSLKVGKKFLCWFNENNDNYKIIETIELKDEVTKLLNSLI